MSDISQFWLSCGEALVIGFVSVAGGFIGWMFYQYIQAMVTEVAQFIKERLK